MYIYRHNPWDFYWLRKQAKIDERLERTGFDIQSVNQSNQKVNFIPGIWEQSYHKNVFCSNTQEWMKETSQMDNEDMKSNEGFLPCFNLPKQYDEFIAFTEKSSINRNIIWISKLLTEASGMGMEIYAGTSKIPPKSYFEKDDNRVVQQYVKDPFLINKKKIDTRLYVVVTSFNSLRVYLHSTGQVNIAQNEYSKDFTDLYGHISNKAGSAGDRAYDLNDKKLRGERLIDEFINRISINDLADRIPAEKWADVWGKIESLISRTMIASFKKLGCNP